MLKTKNNYRLKREVPRVPSLVEWEQCLNGITRTIRKLSEFVANTDLYLTNSLETTTTPIMTTTTTNTNNNLDEGAAIRKYFKRRERASRIWKAL